MRRPASVDYGLCDDFDASAYVQFRDQELRRAKKRLAWLSFIVAYVVTFPVILLLLNGSSTFPSTNNLMGSAFLALWPGAPILAVFLNEVLSKWWLPKFDKNADAFVIALSQWEYSYAETGLGFWRTKRGVEFEHALIRMFVARGCIAQGTKGSGDGGVDIILKVGAATLWCQCKAHTKPISVAPVREIAGVCSRNAARPAVFAINGYTKAARETAQQLGVLLFDAPHIISLAQKDHLRWL